MRSTMWVVLEGLVVLAGCRSGKNVTIVTNPDQAEVVAGGSSVGVTPYVVQKVKYDRGFELRKENYQPRSVTINSSSPGEVLVQLTPKLPEAAVKVTPKPPETAGQSIPEVTVGAQGFEVRHTPVYAEEEVIERSPNVKSVRRLTDMANTRWLGAFCLAPDDRTVVMEVLDEEQVEGGAKKQYSNLWAVSTVGGGGTQHVTQGKCFDRRRSFRPTGSSSTSRPAGWGRITSGRSRPTAWGAWGWSRLSPPPIPVRKCRRTTIRLSAATARPSTSGRTGA